MRAFLVLVACTSLLLPSFASAGSPPRWGPGGPSHPGSGNGNAYGHYLPAYRYYYPRPIPVYSASRPVSYGSGGHHHHDDSDDAWWAIGGLVVGAVIGNVWQRSRTKTQPEPPPPASSPPPVSAPPAPSTSSSSSGRPGPPPGCRDVIVYDSDGNPGVQRQCGDPSYTP